MAKFGDIVGGFFGNLFESTYGAAEPAAAYLGIDPFTVIIFSSLIVAGTVTGLASRDDDDLFQTIHGVGASGVIMLYAFITVDYMKRVNGVEPSTYLGQLIGDISGTTVYLFIMFLILSYGTIELASKSEFMKKFTGFGG